MHHQIGLERFALAVCILLFAPETPLLFMGQEFAASAPFQYFTDHGRELGRLVTEGRRREFAEFFAATAQMRPEEIPDPQTPATFERSKLDHGERETGAHAAMLRLHRDMIRLRSTDPVLRDQNRQRLRAVAITETVLAVHRWANREHRLLVVNFGADTTIAIDGTVVSSSNPVDWSLSFSSPIYFGREAVASLGRRDGVWHLAIAAHCALILQGTESEVDARAPGEFPSTASARL